MSTALRIALIVFSFLTCHWVLQNIRKSKFRIEDSVFWIISSLILLIISIFPQIVEWAAELMGVMSASNLVFLGVIFVLIVKIFQMSVRISLLESKLQSLVQTYAIEHSPKNTDASTPQENESCR